MSTGFYILHEGLIGVLGEQGLQEVSYKTADEKKEIVFNKVHERLARHHRQVLGCNAAARQRHDAARRKLLVDTGGTTKDLSGGLSARREDDRARRQRRQPRHGCSPAPRKRR